jgi:hypothetical protein
MSNFKGISNPNGIAAAWSKRVTITCHNVARRPNLTFKPRHLGNVGQIASGAGRCRQ